MINIEEICEYTLFNVSLPAEREDLLALKKFALVSQGGRSTEEVERMDEEKLIPEYDEDSGDLISYWLVTNRLAVLLKQSGCPRVFSVSNFYVWGQAGPIDEPVYRNPDILLALKDSGLRRTCSLYD
jgi:hypothetical protein